MVSSGLYERGSSPDIDRAVALIPRLNDIFSAQGLTRSTDGFRLLAGLLGRSYAGPGG